MDGRAPREDKVRQQLILVSRAAMSSTIVIGLAQGGTVTILYGLMGIAIINLCVALSIGEVASAYPSAGGQVRSSSNTTFDSRMCGLTDTSSIFGLLFLPRHLVHERSFPSSLAG